MDTERAAVPLAVVSTVLMLASATANVLFIRQNTALRSYNAQLGRQVQVSLNVPMPALTGATIAGTPLKIDLAGSRDNSKRAKIVFVLSSTCGPCNRNWTHWTELLQDQDQRQAVPWQPIFVNVGPPLDPSYVEEHRMSRFVVFDSVSPESMVDYKFYGTPETLVVDDRGRVRRAVQGALTSETIKQIRKLVSESAMSAGRI